MNRKVVAGLAAIVVSISLSGCISSKRQIDADRTNSFPIEGTSWRGFCQGRNAFIYVPGKNDSDPDELEAVIYDDYRCMGEIEPTPSASSKPDADPDGIVDDED